MRFEIMMALRYLGSRKSDKTVSLVTVFSFLGISLGVAALIIVMSVMNGFRTELMNSILGFNGHISLNSYSSKGIDNYNQVLSTISNKVPGIVSIDAIIEKQGIVSSNRNTVGTVIHGIDNSYFQNRKLIKNSIIAGSTNNFQGKSILIGCKMAMKLGVRTGNKLTIITNQKHYTAFGSIPKTRTFIVKGIFKVGMREFDSSVVFIPLEQAQSMFDYKESVNTFEIFTPHPEKIDQTIKNINRLFPELRTVNWQQSNSTFFKTLKVERNVMFIILSLMVLIASFNVAISLIMFIKDKNSNIAILCTMGASRKTIAWIFSLVGMIISLGGVMFGATFGVLLAYNLDSIRKVIEKFSGISLFSDEIYFITNLPVQINTYDISVIILVSLILSWIFSIIPALKVAKLDPSEVLRHA